MGFIKAYVKSMRLYYAFVTGIAGWLGIILYEYVAKLPNATVEEFPGMWRKAVILILLFFSWGINQIINDWLGLKEDRVNAPQRPMVTGELNPLKALTVSCALLAISIMIICVFLEPVAAIPAVAGVLLNIAYEYAKGHGILGNIVFGMMIAMATVTGFLASGPIEYSHITWAVVAVFFLVMVVNGVMTFYTYFKDYKGDRATGKKTLVVKHGLKKSRIIALLAAFMPSVFFLIIYFCGFANIKVNATFVFLALTTFFLQLWTGFLYYRYPIGDKTYYSLAANFRACTCAQATLAALFNPETAIMLFIASYILVGFLFDLHSNSKA